MLTGREVVDDCAYDVGTEDQDKPEEFSAPAYFLAQQGIDQHPDPEEGDDERHNIYAEKGRFHRFSSLLKVTLLIYVTIAERL